MGWIQSQPGKLIPVELFKGEPFCGAFVMLSGQNRDLISSRNSTYFGSGEGVLMVVKECDKRKSSVE